MFQASYLNGIQIKCTDHPRNQIMLVCTDYKCHQNPYICNQCKNLQKHYGHDLKLKQIITAVTQLSQSLAKSKKPIQNMYMKICSQKQNDNLMQYQQQRQQHCQSIRRHIQSIKFQIQQQIANIVKVFQREIQKQKLVMFTQLQRYYQSYREKFDYLSRKIGPIALINNTFKYFSSKSNILLKLLSNNDSSSAIKWFNELKRAVRAGEALTSDPQLQIQKIRNLSDITNELMDKLPRVRSSQYELQLPKILNSCAKETLKQFVKFGEIKHNSSTGNLSSISRSYSINANQHNHNKSTSNINQNFL